MLILVSKSQRKAFDRLVFMVCDILLQFFYPILKYVPIAYFRAGDAVDFNICLLYTSIQKDLSLPLHNIYQAAVVRPDGGKGIGGL